MKNKILLLLVLVLGSIYGCVRSFKKETSYFYSEEKTVRVYDKETGKITKYNMEDYLVGVLAGEMPASFDEEALKAQAVAARSFAYYRMNKNNNYDVTSDNSSQVFLDESKRQKKWGNEFAFYEAKIKKAVSDTKNEVVTYDGKIISAYYFAMSNGYTESSLTVFNEDKSYLTTVKSEEDGSHRAFKVTSVFTKEEFCNKLDITCDNIKVSNITRTSSERINKISINNKTFDGITVRKKLGLRSADFEIKVNSNNVEITTYGYGHGVGMSQYGANTMAKNGFSYEEILSHYYQGTKLDKVTSII